MKFGLVSDTCKSVYVSRHLPKIWLTIMANQPGGSAEINRLIAGLIKGNQELISSNHKAGYFFGGGYVRWGGWLPGHNTT